MGRVEALQARKLNISSRHATMPPMTKNQSILENYFPFAISY